MKILVCSSNHAIKATLQLAISFGTTAVSSEEFHHFSMGAFYSVKMLSFLHAQVVAGECVSVDDELDEVTFFCDRYLTICIRFY